MINRPLCLLLSLTLGACAVGPDFLRPDVPVPAKFKEAAVPPPGWKAGTPEVAEQDRGQWWAVFKDPVLDELLAKVEVNNQSIKAAEAAYRQAKAAVDHANASFWPTLSGSTTGSRSGPLPGSATASSVGSARSGGSSVTTNAVDAGLSADWAPDLWGRIGRTVEAAEATQAVSAADLVAAKLSAQTALATAYFQLRASDQQKRLLGQSIAAYRKAVEIARNRRDAGMTGEADVVSAETQVKVTESQAVAIGIQRAQLEHAIAVLTGANPSDFALVPAAMPGDPPFVPVELPSTLLERRPDIAAAERQAAAANAQIGIAQAAFFPNLTLSGGLTGAATSVAQLINLPTTAWSLGAGLAATIFDGGARSAQVESAKAGYDQSVARYRQTVLSAFQQVEDDLAATRILAEQSKVQAQAVQLARQAEQLTLNQYRAGTVAYTSVLQAQTTALSADLNALQVRLNRLTSAVSLIESLGGGWEGLNSPPAPAKAPR